MFSKLIISFCNVNTKNLALGIYEYENDNFNWIELDQENIINGATGITYFKNRLWLLVQKNNGENNLCSINNNFELEKTYPLQMTKDAHSIIVHDNGFLVNDTKHNRLNKIEIINNQNEIKETEFWKYSNDLDDVVHVNSICKKDNKIFVSMFGKKSEEGWKFTKNGKIIIIPEKKIIFENIFHPHTLFVIENDMYCLESATGYVHKFSKKNGHEVILKLEGYVRGFTFDENYFYVGASARRRRSKSTGTQNVSEAVTDEDAQSWIYRIDRKTLEFERKSLAIYGEEIYDLMIYNQNDYHFSKKDVPILKRVWKYQDEIENYKNELTHYKNELVHHKDQLNKLADIEPKLKKFEKELKIIKNSKTWKALQYYLRFKKLFQRKNI